MAFNPISDITTNVVQIGTIDDYFDAVDVVDGEGYFPSMIGDCDVEVIQSKHSEFPDEIFIDIYTTRFRLEDLKDMIAVAEKTFSKPEKKKTTTKAKAKK